MLNVVLVVMLGMWMIVAPFILSVDDHAWNYRIVGLLVLAAILASRRPYASQMFAAGALGLWLLLSSFIPALLVDGGVMWNAIVSGAVLIVTGTASAKALRRVSGGSGAVGP